MSHWVSTILNQIVNKFNPSSRCIKKVTFNFTFSKHRPSGPMLSISRNVRLCVRLSVCLSVCPFTFEVLFNGLFAPTSQSQIFLEIQDPWGKVERSGLTFEHFWLEVVKNCAQFFFLLLLPYKTWWTPRFQMD